MNVAICVSSQNQIIKLPSQQTVSVSAVIKTIQKQTKMAVDYSNDLLNPSDRVSANARVVKLSALLSEILTPKGLTYEIQGRHVIILKKEVNTISPNVRTNNVDVKGRVVDSKGEPIIGATIRENGNEKNITVTDADGNFSLEVNPGSMLSISYIGYVQQETKAISGKSLLVNLKEDTESLNEVVVIGYGTSRKSDLTGSLSQINSKSFREQAVTGIDQVLQGRASGVQISNTVGAPGGDVRIRVRGANSILGDNSPLFVIDGFVGADYSLLNPNDIQSVEILKDASSTAIYGSRGANGVVLVTTKSGTKSDKVQVNYSGNISVASQLKKYKLLNAGDFATLVNQHDADMGLSNKTFTDEEIADYYKNGGFDYQDAIFRTSASTQQQLSVSGGSDKTKFHVSGNYLQNNGIVRESNYERFSFRANLNTQINKRLSFRFQTVGASSKGKNNQARTGAATPIVQMLSWAPTTDPYDGNGGYTISDPVGSIKANPLAIIYDSENIYRKANMNVMSGATYEIIDGLKFDFSAVADWTFFNDKSWSGNYASNYSPNASKTNSQAKMIQTTTQLTYDKTFGIHHINATAVVETQKYKWEDLSGSASQLKFPELKYDNLAMAGSTSVGTDFTGWQLLSYLGRINYTMKERYLASFSVRRDGSSKFAKDNRYSTFPAGALAWNASEEDFIKNLNIFSKLKLRLSWGLTGSQAINPYATLSGYNTNIYYAYGTGLRTNGIQMSNPGNSNLKWETTEQKDLGLEMGFFQNRLNIEFDYFIKDTRHLLLNKSVPYYLGGGSITSNIGKVRNNGFDVNINADIITGKDFRWNSNLNYSYVKNKVINLGSEDKIFDNADVSGWNGQPEFVYQVGKSLGSLWGLKYLGPWRKDQAAEAALNNCKVGDAHFEDLNGDHSIDGSDYKIIGCAIPKHTLGWNNTISYKQFTLNLFFQGAFNVDKLNYTRCMGICASRDARAATLVDAKDRYIPDVQEDAWIPAWSPTSKWVPASTLFLEDASYLRLKNLSLAYDFILPTIGAVKLSVSVTNLLTITGYKGNDPEASNVGGSGSDIRQGIDYGAYPNARTWTFGVNVTF
jgi:TonB-linked SusC/RagA family outer membrane protein